MRGEELESSRRKLLQTTVSAGAAALAGCTFFSREGHNVERKTPPPTSSEGNGGGSSTDTPEDSDSADTSDIEAPTVEIEVASGPAQLPPIWNNHSIDNFQTGLEITAESDPDTALDTVQASIQTTETTLVDQNPGKPDFERQLSFYPRQETQQGWQEFIQPGENNLSANATDTEGQNASDTATVTLETPDNYKLDIRPGTNEELRSTMETGNGRNNYQAPDGYLQEVEQRMSNHLGNMEDDPVFTGYTSHDQLSHDKETIDLVAAEWRHDNDRYQVHNQSHVQTFLDSIDTPPEQLDEAAKNAKLNPNLALYPNGDREARETGFFDYESFAATSSVSDALDWLQTYLFNLEYNLDGPGPISSEDIQYATELQWALDEHTDINSHFWSFDIGGGSHGNGMVWDYDNHELRVLEPIVGPQTFVTWGEPQHHPLIENSNYLPPGLREEMGGTNLDTDDDGERAYEKFTIPHPLLFGSDYQDEYMKRPFEENKKSASNLLTGIANNTGKISNGTWNVAPTTGYLESVTESLRNYRDWQNPNQQFEKILNQSKVINELADKDSNFVVYGDVDNPQYAEVSGTTLQNPSPKYSDSIAVDIWHDEAGQYDDFDQYLTSDPQYSFSDINTELSGQNTAA